MVKGYKAFNSDWKHDGIQLEVGKTYKIDSELAIFNNGFDFCEKLIDYFHYYNYYNFNPKTQVAEIVASGDIVEDYNIKYASEITIVKVLSWYEVLDLVNTGKDNVGYKNTGENNVGDGNNGVLNCGRCNKGNVNFGDSNFGHCNFGCWNRGGANIGDYNRGDFNFGNHNLGDWNASDYSIGCFNTRQHKIKMFDKDSDWTYKDWIKSRAHFLLDLVSLTPVQWVDVSIMTPDEKAQHPDCERTHGYLKKRDLEIRQKWWNKLSLKNKHEILSLPNFNADIFKQCTGIDVKIEGEEE